MIHSLFSDPATQQSLECMLLEREVPVPVSPQDDDEAHLVALLGRLRALGKTEKPVQPEARRFMLQHIAAHLNKLNLVKPQQAQLWRRHLLRVELAEQAKARAFLSGLAMKRKRAAQSRQT